MQVKKVRAPKSKKNGKQAARPKRPRIPKPTQFMGPSGTSKAGTQSIKAAKDDAYIVAIANPFDVRSLGVKIPDQNNLPSTPIKMNASFFGQVNGSGNAAWAFPPYACAYNISAPVSGSSITWPLVGTGTPLPQYTSLSSQFTTYRVASWGIRVTMSGNVANTQGRLHIAIVPNQYDQTVAAGEYGQGAWPDNVAEFQLAPYYECYSLNELRDNRVIVPGRIIDESSFRYRSSRYGGYAPSAGTAFLESSDGHSTILMFVEGAAANAVVLAVEYVAHYEGYVSYASGAIVNQSTPARPHAPGIMEVANALAIHMPATFYQADKLADMRNVIQKIATGVTFTKHMLPLVTKAFKGLKLP